MVCERENHRRAVHIESVCFSEATFKVNLSSA